MSVSPNILNEVVFSREIEMVSDDLRGFVLSLVLNQVAADDVMQETFLYLWENRKNFKPGTSFRAWAFSVSRLKAFEKRNEFRRERQVLFTDTLLEVFADEAEREFSGNDGRRLDALNLCIESLDKKDIRLLRLKYFDSANITRLSAQANQPANTLHKTLSRIRMRLKICITKRLEGAQ